MASHNKLTVTDDTYKGTTNDYKAELSRLQKKYGDSFKPLYERKWIKIDDKNKNADEQKAENESNSITLSILQFNILANGLSGSFKTGKKSFDKAPKESLDFKFRGFRILEAIIDANADIITLEEVDTFDFLSYYLEPLGYCGCHQPKPKSPCLAVGRDNGIDLPPDGVAIFYKKDKFAAVNVYKYTQPVVAMLIHFRFLVFEKEFLCGVTHLKATKNKKGEQIRLNQLNGLFEQWSNVKKALNGIDLFIGCDFNSPPKDTCGFPPMAYLSVVDGKGFMEKYVQQKKGDILVPKDYVSGYGLDLASAYAVGLGTEPPFTTYKSRGNVVCHTIDYIFYERKSQWKVDQLLSLPKEDEIDKSEYLPGWKYPSDHLSIGAVFKCPECKKNELGEDDISAPVITQFEWSIIGVMHRGKNMVFKDAILTPNGAKSWNWNLDGTRHKPGITKKAVVMNKLCEDVDIVILTKGVNLVLQTKAETKEYLQNAKDDGLIKDFMILQSNEAVVEYAKLVQKGQKVAGLFHSTC